MRIINPIDVTPANGKMTATNIPETDETEYSSATTYALGDKVMVTGTGGGAATATHKIYESLIASNTGNDPTDQTNNADKWLEVSATNRWKMFDQRLADPSTRTGGISITLTLGAIANSVAMFNVDADSVDITITDPVDGVVYTTTVDLVDNGSVSDWYHYFYDPIINYRELVLFDLPLYAAADIDITLNVASGDASVGEIALGRFTEIGDTQFGASIGIIDYSRKDRDTFGNAVVIERDYSQRGEFDLILQTHQTRIVRNQLAALRATPAVWAGKSDGDWGTLIYGYFRDFDIVLSGPEYSDCSIQIEGLV